MLGLAVQTCHLIAKSTMILFLLGGVQDPQELSLTEIKSVVWFQESSLGPCTCQTCVLPLEPHASPTIFYLCVFMATPSNAERLLLAVCLGITPGGAGGCICGLGN